MHRRCIRAILRQAGISCDAGDCTLAAQDLAVLLPGAVVIYNTLRYRGSTMSHAWVEYQDWCIDPTCAVNLAELGIRTAPAILIWPRRTPYPII